MANGRQIVPEDDKIQRKKLDQHKNMRRGRFSSIEAVIALIIAGAVVGIAGYAMQIFVKYAHTSAQSSNAYNLYVAVYATLNIDSFDEEEFYDFKKKYSSFMPVNDMIKGDNPIETSTITRLKKGYVKPKPVQDIKESLVDGDENPVDIKGYIKLEFSETGEMTLYYSEHESGEDPECFPKQELFKNNLY